MSLEIGIKSFEAMKQISRLLSFAAAAAMCFSACSPEELKNGEVNVSKFVTVHFGTENTDPASTKATLTPNAGETAFQAAWENGDAIKVEYSNDSKSETATGTTTATWNETSFESKMPEYTGTWIYDAAYPVPSESDSSVDFGPNRTQKGNAYNSKYDIMIGSAVAENAAAGKDETGKDIVFMMTRQTAIAYFHFTSTLDEAVTSATLTVSGDGAAIASTNASVSNFVWVPAEDCQSITITFPEVAPNAQDFQLWFNVLETPYTSMSLTVETATKTFTISKSTDGVYEAGKLYKVKKSGIAWTDKPAPEPVVLYCSDVTTGSYNSNVSHIKNANLPFEYKQIMANDKNTPTGYGAGQVMQFKSSLGEIYNTESFGSPVKYVEVYAQSSNPFYVYYGDSKAPEGNKISRPTTPNGSKTISIKDNNGNNNVEKVVNYYLLNLSSYNANYIRIVNGSSTNYFYKIVLLFDEPETVRVTGITLDKTEVTINEGENTTLTATIAPADATIKDVNWSSNNESVATVTDGIVSGLSAGSATITATTVDGEFTASCVVTVNELSKISTIAEIKAILKNGTSSKDTRAFDARLTRAVVTYVNGNNAFIEDGTAAILYYNSEHGLNVGDVLTGDFTGSGYSYNGVVEITSVTTNPTIKAGTAPDPTVATLAQISENFDAYDSRWVKLENVTTGVALKSGTRTSSVSQNGSTLPMYAKVQDTELAAESYGDMLCIPCYNKTTKQIGFWDAAHFTPKNVAVTGVTLDKSEVSITVGKTETLTATITPSNATNKNVSWTSNAKDVATVENGVVTAVAEGKATITVTTDDGKHTATCAVTVTAAPAGGEHSHSISETPVYILSISKDVTASSYTEAHSLTSNGVEWSVFGNQTQGDYLRVGGKNTTATDRSLTSTDVISSTEKIGKISINHSGTGNGRNSSITINSIKVEGSVNSDFSSSKIVIINNPSVSSAGTLDFSLDGADFDSNSYFKITINYQISGKNNCYLTINSVEFFSCSAN